jgi:hypothetical protein
MQGPVLLQLVQSSGDSSSSSSSSSGWRINLFTLLGQLVRDEEGLASSLAEGPGAGWGCTGGAHWFALLQHSSIAM